MSVASLETVNGRQLFLTEQRRVEMALPGYSMRVVVGVLIRQGWEFRQDVITFLERSSARYLVDLKPLDVTRVGLKIESIGKKLFREVSTGESPAMVVAFSKLWLMLCETGRLYRSNDEALSVAEMIMNEVSLDAEGWGDLSKVDQTVDRLYAVLIADGMYGVQLDNTVPTG